MEPQSSQVPNTMPAIKRPSIQIQVKPIPPDEKPLQMEESITDSFWFIQAFTHNELAYRLWSPYPIKFSWN